MQVLLKKQKMTKLLKLFTINQIEQFLETKVSQPKYV